MKQRKNKPKTVYREDRGETIYNMSFLDGMTPEEAEELDKKKRNRPFVTSGERWAMIRAAAVVYGPLLLCCVLAFGLAALLIYLFLR